jgi:CYTH domain-containing protein
MKLEIERKFLLKAMPDKIPSEIVKIDQWYWKNSKGVWERARSWDSNINGVSWIHTIKKSVAKGINIEDEHNITKEEYEFFTKRCNTPGEDAKFISKERWIYPDGDLKWEVDMFNSGHHLIVAEIEIPKKSFKVNIPDFIKDKLLMEVTDFKQFSNRNLSNKI